MREYFLPIILVIVAAIAYGEYTEAERIGIIRGGPSNTRPLITADTYWHNGYQPGQWYTIDATEFVPIDAKGIYLSGMLIITHGPIDGEMCGLTMRFRGWGDKSERNYMAQAGTTVAGGGIRQHYGDWIELRSGKFEFKWDRITQGEWPEHCSYALNFRATAYVR